MFSYSLESKKVLATTTMSIFLSLKNGYFPRGSPMVSVKKSTVFSRVFFSKIRLGIMFSYGLERREAFEDDKNVNFF